MTDSSSAAAKNLVATVHVEQDVTIVEVTGRMIGGEETSLLRERIKWLLNSTTNILNLSGITFIDSAGLGVLVSMWSSSKSVGRVLKLASVHGKVKQVLEVTRLSSIFEIYETTGEAIKHVQQDK